MGPLREMIYLYMCFCHWTEFLKNWTEEHRTAMFIFSLPTLAVGAQWMLGDLASSVPFRFSPDAVHLVQCAFSIRKKAYVSFLGSHRKQILPLELWSAVHVHGSIWSGKVLHFYPGIAEYVLVCVYTFWSTV